MKRNTSDFDRRRFLKYGALAGVGALASTAWPGSSWSASKERLT
ncbi:MAG: twin-arginine translocation signal domain-containing protein, partial [Candidatus Binatia bacterium]